MYRHGDLLIKEVKKTAGKLVKHTGSFVLAEGTRTGHHHTLTGKGFKVRETADNRYLEIKSPTRLTHQEHDTITIKPGNYVIEHEREFDYELQEARQVMD